MHRILSLARGGDPEAQFKLSEMYQSGDGRVPFDFAESTRWLIAAAEQGHTVAQELPGEAYYEGYGVEQDFEQAAKWLRAAAKKGNPDAQFQLGRMYARGEADMEDGTLPRPRSGFARPRSRDAGALRRLSG